MSNKIEVLVKPLKEGNTSIAETFRTVLRASPEVKMLPITTEPEKYARTLKKRQYIVKDGADTLLSFEHTSSTTLSGLMS